MVFDLFLLSLSSSFPLLPFPVLELCRCGVQDSCHSFPAQPQLLLPSFLLTMWAE